MKKLPFIYAVLAAVCYGISAPVSKALLRIMPPVLMASFLYLGAGIGMFAVNKLTKPESEAPLTKAELPYIIAMVALDIAAPVFLMLGLERTTSATASLLNNFEIVATTVIAMVFFKESIGKRMWLAIGLITLASVILTVEDFDKLSLSQGAALVVMACICWGFENNCTTKLSIKNPQQIVLIKGLGSGLGALFIAAISKQLYFNPLYIAVSLLLGFVAYGLSIYFYILSQRYLGAARTSAFYALAPFVGVALSFVMFRQRLEWSFITALIIMLSGAYFAAFERHSHKHFHSAVVHEHRHNHNDGHHNHLHEPLFYGEHSHMHAHEPLEHSHVHTPDLHHNHAH